MPYFDPSKPRQPRIQPPKAPPEPVEFVPPVENDAQVPGPSTNENLDSAIETTAPAPIPQVVPETEVSSSPTPEQSEPNSTNDDAHSSEELPEPKKKRGRPQGSKSEPKSQPSAPKSENKKKIQEPDDISKRVRTAVYLLPKDHKRLKMLCVDVDAPMTDFIEDATLSKMYSSYRCSEPACNCEFTIKCGTMEGDPSCPKCGGKKMTRPYLP